MRSELGRGRGIQSINLGPAWSAAAKGHGDALDIAGAGGDGEERVIAPLARVVVALCAFLGQTVSRADSGVQIDDQWIVARACPSVPGSGNHLPAHPIQLAGVASAETPQKSSQRRWCLDRAAQRLLGPASAQRVGVVNAVATDQRLRHQRQQLVASIYLTRRIPQVNVAIHQVAQPQMMGQSDRQNQPCIGHQAVISKVTWMGFGTLWW